MVWLVEVQAEWVGGSVGSALESPWSNCRDIEEIDLFVPMDWWMGVVVCIAVVVSSSQLD